MRDKVITLYQFDELLTDKAKNKAREWMRELEMRDFDPCYESFETAAKLLGIEFDSRAIPMHAGGTRYETDIRYSGFCSQGDGASFVGEYEFKPGCHEAIRKEFPTDTKLHAIADDLTVLFLEGKNPGRAKISQSGRYVHKYTMSIEIADATDNVTADDEEAILELMRDFAQWIYDGLEAEYDYLLSDEAIDETIRANEYEFTEDGERY